MIDRGGRAHWTALQPPWAVPRMYAGYDPVTIQTETMTGPLAPMVNAFSFGVIAVEVCPVYLAAYSVGGGEMDDLTST